MRKHFSIAIVTAAFACLLPLATHAASPVDGLLGKVLIDSGRRGEAWYVNPQSHMKVFLGRPAEALERLKDRAVYVSFGNISRLAESDALPTDGDYAKAVAGYVLAPDDLVGASWYVDTATGLRRRLATADDAWQVMRAGSHVPSAALDAIPSEPIAPASSMIAAAKVKKAVAGNVLELEDGAKVVLLSVDVPANPELQQAAMTRLDALTAGKTVLLEKDFMDKDGQGRLPRFVHVGASNVSYELVRSGLAFHDIGFPNYKHAELLIVGGIDAARLRRGFWDNPSNTK